MLDRQDVDRVEAEHVLANDAIDATVAAPADAFCRVRFRAAVAERDEHVEDGIRKETVVSLEERAEELFCERRADLSMATSIVSSGVSTDTESCSCTCG